MLFYWVGGGEKGFAEVRFVLQIGTFCLETPEHFVLRIINTAHNIWYLIDLGGFYTTAFLSISIYNGEAAAEELTPHFFKFFNTRTENASLGVVYMNFADNLADYGAKYGCDQLIQTIINNNFTFQLRTRGSDSKKSPLMRGVSAGNDDPNSWD